jgi:hypothetical protein
MANSTDFGFNTPFYEQLEFLRKKLNLPTERWDDIKKSAHDVAFMVAGAKNADLVQDMHNAINKAAEQGRGLEDFRRDFKRIVQQRGWVDYTGAGSEAGIAWRTRIIYNTNMRTSYMAGRYKQLTDPEYLKLRPNWKYVHNDSVQHPRPLHLSWNGTVLPHDHPFWKTHFPQNGWLCECDVLPARAGEKITPPPKDWDTIDPKTGEPVGIDKGFGYAPGASTELPIRQFVQDKLITYAPAITKALSRDINKYIDAETDVSDFVTTALDGDAKATLWLGFVENFEAADQALGGTQSVKGYLINLPADAVRHHANSHAFDGAGQRMATPEDYQYITLVLTEPDKLTANGDTLIAVKKIGGETYRVVFDVWRGKTNKSLSFKSLVIKTGGD